MRKSQKCKANKFLFKNGTEYNLSKFISGIMGFGHSYWSPCSVAEFKNWLAQDPANVVCLTKQLTDRMKAKRKTKSSKRLDILSGEMKTKSLNRG